jgi:branched-chain amino acid transport system substrate-binding protein
VKTAFAYAISCSIMVFAVPVRADEVKVGITASFTGPYGIWGKEYQEGIELFREKKGDSIDGHEVTVLYRDVGGANPSRARQLAQELAVRDHVAVMGGHELTPNVLAVTDVINQAKIPFVIFNSGTATVTDKSPYFVRTGFTNWAHYYPLALWAGRQDLKRCVSVVADYAPGHDSLDAIKKGFAETGGKIAEEILVPLNTTDFSPYIQHIRDSSPQCSFVFMPLGPMSLAFVKAYADSGLMKDGVQLLGQSETAESDLPALGDAALGVITSEVYGPTVDNPANRAFVAAYKAKYGQDKVPSLPTLLGYDGMELAYRMIQATGGKIDGEKAMAAIKGYSWQSPRGPVTIDAQTREPIQNVYIRRVVRENGVLYNKTIYTFEAQKEPYHEFNKTAH